MIVVKMLGGLGNQLFQLAYAIELSRLCSDKDIILDVSRYKKYKVRSFAINNMDIANQFVISEKSRPILFIFEELYRVYQKIMKTLRWTDKYGKLPYYFLSKFGLYFNFDQMYYEIDNHSRVSSKYVFGYFQSEKYFRESSEHIKKYFNSKSTSSLKEKEYINIIRENCSDSVIDICISMRLGKDYFSCKDLNVCDHNYYLRAIKNLEERFPSNNKLRFFVFSDDLSEARNILTNYGIESMVFVSDLSDYESLRVMACFKYYIIPNSSFSWWGAYLSELEDKLILCPERWFNNISDDSDIYTSDMIRVGDKY